MPITTAATLCRMNRQVRRIEKKKELKAEKDKAKAKAERQARREQRREARKRPRGEEGSKPTGESRQGPRQSNPGRFSAALMAATVFFISLQAVAPTDGSIPSQVVSASFYLLFGYFAVLWMMRRGATHALAVAIGAGALMAVVTLISQLFQAGLEPLPIMLGLTVPLTVAGAFLGRLVWNRAP